MTKVVLVCPREPWYHGGQEKVVANTALHLKNNFEVEIFCTGDNNYEKIWNDIPVHVFRGYTKGYLYSSRLKKEIKRSDFDIIHAHGFTVHSSYVASKEKKSASFIFNPHFHDIGSTLFYRGLRMLYDPIIGKRLLKQADQIICVSEMEKEWLDEKYKIENKVIIIPNGIDVDKINNAKPNYFQGKLILYIGRLEKYKNVQILIRVLKYLPNEFYLNIIGHGYYKNALLSLIKQLDLEERVRILIDLEDKDTYRWLKTCNIMVNLSDMEAFGITAIEALCAEKPVIVNNKGGLRELARIYRDSITPINLNEFSLSDLAQLIIEKSSSSVKVDVNRYRWENISQQIEKTYRNFMG